jgi:ribosomal protein S18 acetylase RimI-like enzyme
VGVSIRPRAIRDLPWLTALLEHDWGGPIQVVDGRAFAPAELPGFVAEIEGERVGFAAMEVEGHRASIAMIHALRLRSGVGSALVEAVDAEARRRGCSVLQVVTTNDNTDALAFYRALGFVLTEIRDGAVDRSRERKPTIPLTAADGTPIRDEWVFVRSLLG